VGVTFQTGNAKGLNSRRVTQKQYTTQSWETCKNTRRGKPIELWHEISWVHVWKTVLTFYRYKCHCNICDILGKLTQTEKQATPRALVHPPEDVNVSQFHEAPLLHVTSFNVLATINIRAHVFGYSRHASKQPNAVYSRLGGNKPRTHHEFWHHHRDLVVSSGTHQHTYQLPSS